MDSSAEDIVSLIKQAELCRDSGRVPEARALYEQVLSLQPNEEFSTLGLGVCARREGDHEKALEFHRQAKVGHPQSYWPNIEAAEDYFALGRLAEAQAEWQAALALQPGQPNAVHGLVKLAELRDDLPGALAALEAWPAPDAAILLKRCAIMRKLNRDDDALALLQSGAAQFPNDPSFLIEQAIILRHRGELLPARELLIAAIDRDPRNPKALLTLSDYARQAQNHEEARLHLQRAKDQCAPDIWVDLCLAQTLFELGQYEASEQSLLAAQAAYHGNPLVSVVMAELYARRGRVAEARALVAGARAMAPGDPNLVLLEAELAQQAGYPAAAARILAAMAPGDAAQRARQLYLEGCIADVGWRRHAAAALYHETLLASPDHRGALTAQLRLALLGGDMALALEHLLAWSKLEMPDRQARGLPLNVSQSFFGQLYEEYCLDRRAGARLTEIMQDPAAKRLPRLLELASGSQNWTPSAIAVMLALREAGLLARDSDYPEAGARPCTIPQRITQYWYAPEPPADIVEYTESWRRLNPDYQYRRYDDAAAKAWLGAYSAPALMAYSRATTLAQKSDIFRLAVLAHEGGWYADADDRCVAPLQDWPANGADLVVYQEEYSTLGNNLIGAAPGNAVIAKAFESAVEALLRGDSDLIWLSTGPGLLTRSFVSVLLSFGREWPRFLERSVILSLPELRRVAATHCYATYKVAGQHWGDMQFGNKLRG